MPYDPQRDTTCKHCKQTLEYRRLRTTGFAWLDNKGDSLCDADDLKPHTPVHHDSHKMFADWIMEEFPWSETMMRGLVHMAILVMVKEAIGEV